MLEKESWETCTHSRSNFDVDLETILKTRSDLRIIIAIHGENTDEYKHILDEEDIPSVYYCANQIIRNKGIYLWGGPPKEYEGFEKWSVLFKLKLEEDDFGCLHNEIPLHEEIKSSFVDPYLRMCQHCKFYERKNLPEFTQNKA